MKLVFALLFVVCFYVSSAFAVTDTILFGGPLGTKYVPNSLSVHVGDTVVWTGTLFTYHPLESTARPAGADTIGMDTGSSYMYIIKIPGTYNYQCFYHNGPPYNMKGTITASKASVQKQESNAISAQNFPNPFQAATTIQYELQNPAAINLKIFDLNGKEIHSISGFQNAGMHELNFDGSNLPNGNYYYQIQSGDAVLYRRMLILR